MLWLEQFSHLMVHGAATTGASLNWQLLDQDWDVVLLNTSSAGWENLPAIRTLKSIRSKPAVLLLYKEETPIDLLLLSECDGQVPANASLNELIKAIDKASNKHRSCAQSAGMPATKAG